MQLALSGSETGILRETRTPVGASVEPWQKIQISRHVFWHVHQGRDMAWYFDSVDVERAVLVMGDSRLLMLLLNTDAHGIQI